MTTIIDLPQKITPSPYQGYQVKHDLASLEGVERHLKNSLEIEHLSTGPRTPRANKEPCLAPACCERRLNRIMRFDECFPDGQLALRGRLSGLSSTLDPFTYRAYLYRAGSIVTILYINFQLQTCLTAAIGPARILHHPLI